ncbi:hypothetical protein PAN31108_02448 [Pandoraea anhela]|uniref:Uncharacterized protein n=2 Tax=Pandoraea anhela TaxID=2508295 RepID=A0A5E4V5E5_9BURK|nr:hypothetical protein PAN31108_02448 [Pandoraea anhela]
MTLRSGNPQALLLPSQCLHHYHVDPHADAALSHDMAARSGVTTRVGRWLRSLVKRYGQARRA